MGSIYPSSAGRVDKPRLVPMPHGFWVIGNNDYSYRHRGYGAACQWCERRNRIAAQKLHQFARIIMP